MQYDLEKKNINGVFASFCNPYACPELLGDAFKGASKDIYQAKFTNAATWLVSRECLKNIGGFNPAFFLYSEDDEYARRVNYHGGKIGIAPAVSALHNDRVISRRPMGHKFFHKLAIYFDPANSSPSLFKVMVAWLDSLFRSFSQFGHSRQLIRQLGYLYKNHLVSQTKREKLKKKSPHFLRSSAHDDM